MIGKKIFELRKSLNISQEELALAINTSRQSVSKWELGDAYPEVNKLKDIASFFNVSIDYLLDYDMENIACNKFLKKLENAINTKEFSISLNEIKTYISRFYNNMHLYIYSSQYLCSLEIEKNERNLLDIIIAYLKKAIILYGTQERSDVSLNDIHLFIIRTYLIYKKYDLAKDYMHENRIYDKRVLAECNYRLAKYDDTSNIVSNIYIESIEEIISSQHIQVRILLKQKLIKEAYDLTNWVLNLIDSIKKQDDCFNEVRVVYLFLKAVCEQILKISFVDTIKELKNIVKDKKVDIISSERIKFYTGESHALYSDMTDYKKRLKEEILEDKDEYFNFLNEVYKEVFGGEINE